MNDLQNKNILLIYYDLSLPGGVTRVLINLANELITEGYKVTILVLVNKDNSYYAIDERITIKCIDTYDYWTFTKLIVGLDKYFGNFPFKNSLRYYIYDFGQWRLLNKWLNKNHKNYDTIISSWYKLSSQLAINKNVNYKTIAWEHTNFEIGGLLWNKILRRFYNNLQKVICINTPSKKYYEDKGLKVEKISNIIGSPFESNNSSNLESKQNTLIYVGRLDNDKNVDEILDILNEIDFKNFKFKIIGDGPNRAELEQKVNSIEYLNNKIEFLGSKNSLEIFEELNKSKVFLFTSKVEGLPTVLIEAMMCGNAIISYDCNYGPSDIVNESNGFLIPMHNKQNFISELQYLIDNPEKLENLCKTSFENSKNWNKTEIIKLWKKTLNPSLV